jgi:COMPASS component SWD1
MQEDEAVIYERKMKAEEDPVDIDTVINPTGPGTTSATSLHANRSAGPGTGVVTPIVTNGIGGGPAALAVDGALGRLGSNVDLDVAWAEEDPDGDDPGMWGIKVVMEHEESVGYY